MKVLLQSLVDQRGDNTMECNDLAAAVAAVCIASRRASDLRVDLLLKNMTDSRDHL